MATIIEQAPLHTTLPVGQDVIFTVSNNIIVANQTKVKFVAEVHISSELTPNLSNTTDIIGTFKTTPNNAGVGMFNFRPIIESYVKADNMAKNGSAYKQQETTDSKRHPIHLVDKYSRNTNCLRYLAIQFKVQYVDASGTVITAQAANTGNYTIFNGYLKYTDVLDLGINSTANDFGFDLDSYKLDGITKNFLTNASTTQYANIEDYGTVAVLMLNPLSNAQTAPLGPFNSGFQNIKFEYFEADGTSIDSETIRLDDENTGGFTFANRSLASNMLNFAGVYPANLRGWSTKFNTNINDISYYTFKAQKVGSIVLPASETYRININCPTLKGYEPIRLCWLNQWGAWDYYTFTMKSTRMISTKGSTYNQLEGTWNEAAYRIDSFKGGKKAFRVNATEKISMNTDFVNEAESEWFEELINSPEVYILKGYQTDITTSALNQYVTPVRLTTSSYTRKTVANDKLMQYTFEVEKSKTLRTQSI